MNPRAGISILVCSIGILSAHAQSEKKDSLKTGKEGEIYINPEAVKSIQFNFLPQTEPPKQKPRMDETKPWMEFRKDLPKEITKSLRDYKPKDTLTMKLDLKYLKEKYGYKNSGGFDTDKILFENLTKRGRAIKRNKKKAKAWKIYKDYVPTKDDSLKLYGNKKKRIPKDTLIINKDSIDHHFMNTK